MFYGLTDAIRKSRNLPKALCNLRDSLSGKLQTIQQMCIRDSLCNSSAKVLFPKNLPPGDRTFRMAFTSLTLEITSNSLARPGIP